MSLAPGVRLGAYEITAAIGAGGMGEVYRARDTRLNRDVAIKILPDVFAADADRVARFQREAQVLASLNHPNIAHIHGLEDTGTSKALVLELVDGPTLADVIAKGPIPIDEALPIAKQIAEALEAAHEHGVIHRDLKPANIKLTSDGTVKILDFGLAKGLETPASGVMLSMSPTITSPALMTGGGVILGTAAYMSPEQARGKPVDKRTDIWAFGCVLFELLSGAQAFAGETVSDTVAAVLTRDPDWTKLPPQTSETLRKILRRCLEKNPKRRLRDAGDLQFELEDSPEPSGPESAVPAVPAPAGRRSLARAAMWSAVVLGISTIAFIAGTRRAAPSSPFPTSWQGEMLGGPTISLAPSISPDGTTLAFTAMVQGQTQVAVMKPQSGNWQILTRNRARGIAGRVRWSRDGAKLFFDRFLNVPVGIYTVPVFGGEEQLVLENAMGPEPLPDGSILVTRVNEQRQRQLYRYWPETQRLVALPALVALIAETAPVSAFRDGREAVFVGRPLDESNAQGDRLYVVDLERGTTRAIAPGIVFEPRWSTYPLAVTADGKWTVFRVQAGSLDVVMAAPRDASSPVMSVLTTTQRITAIDVGTDGAIYVDQSIRPAELQRFHLPSQDIERFTMPSTFPASLANVLPLPDGRLVISAVVLGRNQLMVKSAGDELTPFVPTDEDTGGPLALVGRSLAAFVVGSGSARSIALASLTDGRIVRRIVSVGSDTVGALSGSVDGLRIYFVRAGEVWTAPIDGGEPRKLRPGDAVAVDPSDGSLVILMNETEGVRLERLTPGGERSDIPLPKDAHLFGELAGNAIDQRGRIAVRLVVPDSWFWGAGVLDPKTGKVEPVAGGDRTDMARPGWDSEGRLVTPAHFIRSNIWRFSPQSAP